MLVKFVAELGAEELENTGRSRIELRWESFAREVVCRANVFRRKDGTFGLGNWQEVVGGFIVPCEKAPRSFSVAAFADAWRRLMEEPDVGSS